MIKELTESIAQALVDHPETVCVTLVDDAHTSVMRISAGKGETGKIIGKQGRTVEALRTILKAIATRENKRVFLEIENEFENLTTTSRQKVEFLETRRKRQTQARF
jgi:predicted RNA-binding protein YlqC (UPF0109 family)